MENTQKVYREEYWSNYYFILSGILYFKLTKKILKFKHIMIYYLWKKVTNIYPIY